MNLQAWSEQGTGWLTTEHAASSYGMPVVVVDGIAYSPAEAGTVNTAPLDPDEPWQEELVLAARDAGYEVYC